MMQKRSMWRKTVRVIGTALTLFVPVLALVIFGGNAVALLSGPAGGGPFRVLDTPPVAQTAAVRPQATPQADEPTEVQLSNWEETALESLEQQVSRCWLE